MASEVVLWTGAGQIGMAIARRVGYGKKILVPVLGFSLLMQTHLVSKHNVSVLCPFYRIFGMCSVINGQFSHAFQTFPQTSIGLGCITIEYYYIHLIKKKQQLQPQEDYSYC